MPQGSFLGRILFNLIINYLFPFTETENVGNFFEDSTAF